MALRQMLGVGCLAYHLILATPAFVTDSIRTSDSIHSSVGLPYHNSTISKDFSSSTFSTPSTVDTVSAHVAPTPSSSSSSSRILPGTNAVSLDRPRPSSSDSASLISIGASEVATTDYYSTSVSSSASITPPRDSVGTYNPVHSVTNSSSLPLESSQPSSTRASRSSQPSIATLSRLLASGKANYTSLLPLSSPSSTAYSSHMPIPPKPDTTKVGSIGRPLTGDGSGSNRTYTLSVPQLQLSSHAVWSDRNYSTSTGPSGRAVETGKSYTSRMTHATGGSGTMYNLTKAPGQDATISRTANASRGTLTSFFASSTVIHQTLVNGTLTAITFNQSVIDQSARTNSSSDNTTLTKTSSGTLNSSNSTLQLPIWTLSNLTLSNSTLNDTTAVNSSMSDSISSDSRSNGTTSINATFSAWISMNSTSGNQTLGGPFWSNSTLNSTAIINVNETRQPIFAIGAGAVSKFRLPLLLRPGNIAFTPDLAFNQTAQCSGTITVNPRQVTITYTAITDVYETTTLYGNAATPSPTFYLPPTACARVMDRRNDPNPGPEGTTLLVTKKIPVVVRSPQTVGPIYNVPTTTAQPVQVQSAADSSHAGDLPAEKMQESVGEDKSAGSAPLQQAFALAASPAPSPSQSFDVLHANSVSNVASPGSNAASSDPNTANSGSVASTGTNAAGSGSNSAGTGSSSAGSGTNVANLGSDSAGTSSNSAGSGTNVANLGSGSAGTSSNSAGSGTNVANSGSDSAGTSSNSAGSGSNAISSGSSVASSGSKVQPAIGQQAPGKDRSGGQSSQTAGQIASEGQTIGNDGQRTSGGQASSEGGQAGQNTSGNQNLKGEGQTPGGKTTSEAGDQLASTGGQSASGFNQPASDQTVSGQSSSGGASTGSQKQGSGASSSAAAGGGDQASAGNSGAVGGTSSTPEHTSEGIVGGAGSDNDQYVPNAVNINNVPISIDSTAVIVGSETINAGSPPTTVVANGQTITVDHSQIIAPGTTIPIEAAVASQPASSVTIGSVPVVLRPSNVVIGSQTFSHGSSAAFAVYNDQTYSWDAKQLVGPGGSMAAFPSATTVAPRITAGGQVFSVLSSTLKASGTDIAIPNTPSPSPFVYQNQTFSVNPSQLVAPDMSLTVPPATAQPTPFVYSGQTFSVDNSHFIAPSATIPLSSGSGTVRYGTTVLTVDQTQVICPDTTIALSSVHQAGSLATPSAVTTGGLTFSLGPAAAVIASSTYSFLPGQAPATVTDQGQTVTLVSSGVQFGNINVPVPTSPPIYSVVSQRGLTFSVAPSAVVFNGQTNSVQPGMAPTTTTVNGQEISIGSQGVGLAGTSIPLPVATNASGYAVVTQSNITFSVAPSAVVLNGQTNSVQAGMAPITTEVNGQTVSIGPQGVGLASTTIPLPRATNSAGYAVVTQGDLTFSLAPSAVVLNGQTNTVGSGMTPITTTVEGQTVSIGPQGVGIANNTIPIPTSPPPYAIVTRGSLTFSVAPSEVIVKGSTVAIGPNMTATMVVDGQTVAVGPNEINFSGTTVNLPSTTSNQSPASVTADGLTFAVGPTDAVIGGTTYAIGSGAVAKTIVVGSETIGLGTNGVILASTTVPPEQTPTAVTADGLTFSADATEAIINGTAYAIGSQAIAKTIVYGSETIGLGTKGIVFPSTTIVPWANATRTSLSSMYSASAAAASSSMFSVSAAADSVNAPPTGLPDTQGTKSDIHRGTGHSLGPPDILVLGATVCGLIIGLLACL